VIDFVAGFLSAWILRSLLQRKLSRRGGNIGATPLVRNEGRTTAPPAPERWATVTVQGLNWPATLGDFTLVGPVNNQGAWRWYERHHRLGHTERVKVDHQLMPLFPPHLSEP
jgi:hypothetical protein